MTLNLDDLERKARAATRGTWRKANNRCAHVVSDEEGLRIAQCGDYKDKEVAKFSGDRWNSDAEHIAACSPDVILELIERLKAVESALEELGEPVILDSGEIHLERRGKEHNG